MSAPKAGFRCIFAFDAFFNARNVKLDFKDDRHQLSSWSMVFLPLDLYALWGWPFVVLVCRRYLLDYAEQAQNNLPVKPKQRASVSFPLFKKARFVVGVNDISPPTLFFRDVIDEFYSVLEGYSLCVGWIFRVL